MERKRSGSSRSAFVLAFALASGAAWLVARAELVKVAYPHGEFRGDCSSCHSPDRWTPAEIADDFDHAALGFALEGAHRSADCRACHRSLEFSEVRSDCAGCHDDVHRGELGADCSQCHSTSNFLDHSDEVRSHAMTRFPLTGAHASADCASCHKPQAQGRLRFVNTPTECSSCHLSDYLAARDPDHVALGFDRNCASCHRGATWSGARFDHAATGFPLTGAHASTDCASCHGTGASTPGADAQCVNCHQADFNAAVSPNHVSGGFQTDCARCHGSGAWSPASFDHSLTSFPLTGAHVALECRSCHSSGVYGSLPGDCSSCHLADYQAAPGHTTGGYSLSCTDCHSTATWSGAAFDHTFFPLTGGHSGPTCQSCHTSGVYATMPSECQFCHQADYLNAANHVAGNFPQTCEQCHTIQTWTGASFDHSLFPLTGGHASLDCVQCHSSGVYTGLQPDCIACHQSEYQTAPGHVTSSFPQTCEQCHTVQTWTGATVDHSFFALSGGHSGLTCQSCHTNGAFTSMPTECQFCHQADYLTAAGHVAGNFPQSCEQCHTIQTWSGATYDHSLFPLTGGHSNLDCAQCHASGIYTGLPADCIACHQSDYAGAPDHTALAFPQDCQECHTIQSWSGTTFVHPWPLRGPHSLSTRRCSDCHISGTTQDFSCLGSCHEHTVSGTNSHHQGVSGYVYEFNACVACHPNGRA